MQAKDCWEDSRQNIGESLLGGQQTQGRDKKVSPSSQSRRGGAGLTAVSGQEAGDSLSSGQQTQLRGRETAGRTAGEN